MRPRGPTRFALALAVLLAGVASAGFAQMLIVVSEDAPFYHEAAAEAGAQVSGLRDGRLTVEVVPRSRLDTLDAAALARRELVVTIGVAAAAAVLDAARSLPAPPPVLCLVVPQSRFAQLAADQRAVSAVYAGQPLARQLDLIQLALPGRSRVGTVLGPSSRLLRNELHDLARARSLRLDAVVAESTAGVFAAMQDVLRASDVFLAVPDAAIINESTAYSVLRTSYSAGVPVMGFSQSMVRAGALIGLYSTARQYGRQAGEIARRLLAGDGALPQPEYPRYFTVGVNASVARSLNIRIEDEGALAQALANRERIADDPAGRRAR
ncbi:MAG: hypothetical protein IT518_00355 [Burkholderiales bacterium]|nr:hypothetical protein [Burkholderiales bacterium]